MNHPPKTSENQTNKKQNLFGTNHQICPDRTNHHTHSGGLKGGIVSVCLTAIWDQSCLWPCILPLASQSYLQLYKYAQTFQSSVPSPRSQSSPCQLSVALQDPTRGSLPPWSFLCSPSLFLLSERVFKPPMLLLTLPYFTGPCVASPHFTHTPCGAGTWTPNLASATQVSYHWIPGPLLTFSLETGLTKLPRLNLCSHCNSVRPQTCNAPVSSSK